MNAKRPEMSLYRTHVISRYTVFRSRTCVKDVVHLVGDPVQCDERVVSSTIGFSHFSGPRDLLGFCNARSTPVPTSTAKRFSKTSLNMSAMHLESKLYLS